MDDKDLLNRYIAGDESALAVLVRQYQKELYAFIYRHVGNMDDAADLTQKVFVNVFLKAEQFNGTSSFKTWLYQIAVNQCKNHYRSRDRQRIEDVELETLPLCIEDDKVEVLVSSQEQTLLRAAIDGLPERQRLTVRLRLYQDCTFAEIADIMSSSVGTAKAHYHQAVTTLRKTLSEEQYASQ